MNTAQYHNNKVDRALIQKLFMKLANKYGSLWTGRLGEHGDWKACEDDWLEELNAFSYVDAVKGIKKALVIYKDFPPTQGQIIDLCLKESGVPSEDDVIKLMVDRNFNHPMVKLVYEKIGGWMLTNGKADDVSRKVRLVYSDCLANFTRNPEVQWAQLEEKKEQLSLAPVEHPKIPTDKERKTFAQRMEEFKRLAEEGKAKLKDMQPIEFDEKKIGPEGEQRADYEKYLLSVPEHLVLGIPPRYAYDRQRLLNKKDTERHLRESGFIPPNQRIHDEPPRSGNNKPTKLYKNWGD